MRHGERENTHAVHIRNDRSYAREAGTATGYDAHILVRVFALLALPVVHIIEVRDGFTELCRVVEIRGDSGKGG